MTIASKTAIPTEHASRYLQQLCKHFAHKRSVSFDEQAGEISFSVGDCRLKADGSALHIDLTAPGVEEMEQLKDVVIRHLVRFAFREELAVDWQDA
ncbi:DUF2218 domain-containing protein [Shinella kummerowiae]|jgi:hypothetical protein|uniref:DUF2218 domain-containing protein n=1 Tax=Shinella kummerowiae TaxID=417745 RepID=UPI0021B53F6A|nr:DUF2218 domain-containing protein [Shinella kummerowiae]MCT7666897.1 DUF2218 domain-containing protein [Shinella kummerowiae]